jgi:hypothetical protein
VSPVAEEVVDVRAHERDLGAVGGEHRIPAAPVALSEALDTGAVEVADVDVTRSQPPLKQSMSTQVSLVPSGEKDGTPSMASRQVNRRTFDPSVFIR